MNTGYVLINLILIAIIIVVSDGYKKGGIGFASG